ncbi:MAG: hypothetical protein WDW36_006666 [Sanguina aurantia]
MQDDAAVQDQDEPGTDGSAAMTAPAGREAAEHTDDVATEQRQSTEEDLEELSNEVDEQQQQGALQPTEQQEAAEADTVAKQQEPTADQSLPGPDTTADTVREEEEEEGVQEDTGGDTFDAPREPSGSGLVPDSTPPTHKLSLLVSSHVSPPLNLQGALSRLPPRVHPCSAKRASSPGGGTRFTATAGGCHGTGSGCPCRSSPCRPSSTRTGSASEQHHQGSGVSTPRGEDDPQLSLATGPDGVAKVVQQQLQQLQPPSTTASTLLGSGSTQPGTSQSVLRPVSGTDSAGNAYPAPSPQTSSYTQSRANSSGMAGSSLSGREVQLSPVTSKYISDGLRAISVDIDMGPEQPHRTLQILIDYSQVLQKPYLGGYRNKRTGVVYHHGGTQTPRQPKPNASMIKQTRETQTVKSQSRTQQSKREASTQVARPGMLLNTIYDREVTPGPYQTADQRDVVVEDSVRTIQRYMRGLFGRRRASHLLQKKVERDSFLREQEVRAQRGAEEHRRKEIERRMAPRTAADFEILFSELEAWRLQETRKIKGAGLAKEQEAQVLAQLLSKEAKLLQTIDRLKINANHENKDARVARTLSEMAQPKRYELKNGGKVEVHTPFTTRAKELQQLYRGLNLPALSIDERLDVLLHVKWTVKEFDCNLTRELVELIDREADLLNRGRSPSILEGLRKRVTGLFLSFIETPEFNPEASRFQVVPLDFEAYLYENVALVAARSTARN